MEAVRPYQAATTFFIPASVLERSPGLIRRIQRAGAEIGIHGYVHNDYRTLTKEAQARQTRDAISVFDQAQVRYLGFRIPIWGGMSARSRSFALWD